MPKFYSDIVSALRAMRRGEHDDLSLADEAADRIEKLEFTLERCRTVLGNMASEYERADRGWSFGWEPRWKIHHEPLRADAKNLLPIIDEALSDTAEFPA